MNAKERLYLTADKKTLVRDGDSRAATLYCSPGDLIPESAAAKFGLVDGLLAYVATISEGGEAILRVAATGGLTIGIAGFTFTSAFQEILSGQIDEAQLLAILDVPQLIVEAALDGDTPAWVEFPAREEAIATLKERVAADIQAGRPHPLVEYRRPAEVEEPKAEPSPAAPTAIVPAEPAPAAPAPPVPATPAGKPASAKKPAATKAGAKEAAPGQDKEKKGGSTKEAAPSPNKEKAPGGDKAATPASSLADQGDGAASAPAAADA